jgi:hypothetical protein
VHTKRDGEVNSLAEPLVTVVEPHKDYSVRSVLQLFLSSVYVRQSLLLRLRQ